MCIHVETFNANKVKKLEKIVFLYRFCRFQDRLAYLLTYLLA